VGGDDGLLRVGAPGTWPPALRGKARREGVVAARPPWLERAPESAAPLHALIFSYVDTRASTNTH
jgi:hypothetical protein